MSHQMNLFSGVVVDYLIEKLKKELHPAIMSFTRVDNTFQLCIQRGSRKVLKGIAIQSNAQVSLNTYDRQLNFSLSHPDALHRISNQIIRVIQQSFDPFDDETIGPELIRRLVVWKAIKIVERAGDETKKRIHTVVSQGLKGLGLEPMRFPNSRRDQIRRAFLLLVGLESAPESCKASWMQEFQTASCELGTMRIDGEQISFNPYLLYRKLQFDENLRKEVADACRPFQLFVERETIDTVIDDWTR